MRGVWRARNTPPNFTARRSCRWRAAAWCRPSRTSPSSVTLSTGSTKATPPCAWAIGNWCGWGGSGPWELYNLKADRTELHDLAAAEACPRGGPGGQMGSLGQPHQRQTLSRLQRRAIRPARRARRNKRRRARSTKKGWSRMSAASCYCRDGRGGSLQAAEARQEAVALINPRALLMFHARGA